MIKAKFARTCAAGLFVVLSACGTPKGPQPSDSSRAPGNRFTAQGSNPSQPVAAAVAATAPASIPKAVKCTASYAISLTIELNSRFTNGETKILVELREGVVGHSKVFGTDHFVGRTASVGFSNMCAGTYFIALGNGSEVLVGPTRVFSDGQRVSTRLVVTGSAGNVGTRPRSSL